MFRKENIPVLELRLALRSKQCFALAQVVAKITSRIVMKFGKGIPFPAFHASLDEILAYNAIHL